MARKASYGNGRFMYLSRLYEAAAIIAKIICWPGFIGEVFGSISIIEAKK